MTKAQLESAAWAKRAGDLETILREVGLEARLPPPLDLAKKMALVDENVNRPEGNGELELLAAGVGSLSICEEDGSTRFLGTSSSASYFDNVSFPFACSAAL